MTSSSPASEQSEKTLERMQANIHLVMDRMEAQAKAWGVLQKQTEDVLGQLDEAADLVKQTIGEADALVQRVEKAAAALLKLEQRLLAALEHHERNR